MIRVLFVCVENSCRSQMAEALAIMHGKNILEPYSAGSDPSGVVNEKAINSMKKKGYDLSLHRSKSLAEIPDVEYDLVVTMGCGDECPYVRAKNREEWDIPDPKDMGPVEFVKVRDMIEERVKGLIKSVKDTG